MYSSNIFVVECPDNSIYPNLIVSKTLFKNIPHNQPHSACSVCWADRSWGWGWRWTGCKACGCGWAPAAPAQPNGAIVSNLYKMLALLVMIDIPLKSGIIRTKSILQSSIAISQAKCRYSRLVMTNQSCKTQIYRVHVSMSRRGYCVQLTAQSWQRIILIQNLYLQDMAPKAFVRAFVLGSDLKFVRRGSSPLDSMTSC